MIAGASAPTVRDLPACHLDVAVSSLSARPLFHSILARWPRGQCDRPAHLVFLGRDVLADQASRERAHPGIPAKREPVFRQLSVVVETANFVHGGHLPSAYHPDKSAQFAARVMEIGVGKPIPRLDEKCAGTVQIRNITPPNTL